MEIKIRIRSRKKHFLKTGSWRDTNGEKHDYELIINIIIKLGTKEVVDLHLQFRLGVKSHWQSSRAQWPEEHFRLKILSSTLNLIY